ncbi:hypothetical protein M885DRAFT_534551 [Pelagophyceae sp. CCMP2097]|nr:hypothetical protein M885DRAFT_534551 [Pelagophyceae sp. CCMP2097]
MFGLWARSRDRDGGACAGACDACGAWLAAAAPRRSLADGPPAAAATADPRRLAEQRRRKRKLAQTAAAAAAADDDKPRLEAVRGRLHRWLDAELTYATADAAYDADRDDAARAQTKDARAPSPRPSLGDSDYGGGAPRAHAVILNKLREAMFSSYYGRVGYRVIFADARYFETACHYCLAWAMLVLSLGGLNAIWSEQWFLYIFGHDPDIDDAYPGGIPYPANYVGMLRHEGAKDFRIFGLPAIIFIPLFLCVVLVGLSLQEKVQACALSMTLLRAELALGPPAREWPRFGLACMLIEARVLFLGISVITTQQIIGFSDGPLNLLLNATAILFLADLDKMIKWDVDNTMFGCVRAHGRKRYFADVIEQKALRVFGAVSDSVSGASDATLAFVAFSEHFGVGAISLLMFASAAKLQNRTSSGEIIIADDQVQATYPGDAGDRIRIVHRASCTITFLALIIIVNAASHTVTRSLRLTAAFGLADAALLYVLYTIFYKGFIFSTMAGILQGSSNYKILGFSSYDTSFP